MTSAEDHAGGEEQAPVGRKAPSREGVWPGCGEEGSVVPALGAAEGEGETGDWTHHTDAGEAYHADPVGDVDETVGTAGGAPAGGVVLIEPVLLRREIGCRYVDDDPVEATSQEDEQRRKFLRRYADAPRGLFRRHLVADAGTLARLAALRAEAPNATRLIDVVERACQLSWHAGSPLRLPPVLLIGPPGTGKSRVARRIAEVIGTTLTVIDGGSTTDRGPIVGHDPGYRGSGPGKVAAALLDGPTTSPLILLEELDKVTAYSHAVRPLDALLPLLEPSTARSFVDTYLALPMRADGVSFIMTTNSVAGIPAPLLDRVIVVGVAPLGRAEMRDAVQRLYAELLTEHGLPAGALGEAALKRLQGSGLRHARRVLAMALGPALAASRDAPDAADIAAAATLVGRPAPPLRRPTKPAARPREPVGFLRFPAEADRAKGEGARSRRRG